MLRFTIKLKAVKILVNIVMFLFAFKKICLILNLNCKKFLKISCL